MFLLARLIVPVISTLVFLQVLGCLRLGQARPAAAAPDAAREAAAAPADESCAPEPAPDRIKILY